MYANSPAKVEAEQGETLLSADTHPYTVGTQRESQIVPQQCDKVLYNFNEGRSSYSPVLGCLVLGPTVQSTTHLQLNLSTSVTKDPSPNTQPRSLKLLPIRGVPGWLNR